MNIIARQSVISHQRIFNCKRVNLLTPFPWSCHPGQVPTLELFNAQVPWISQIESLVILLYLTSRVSKNRGHLLFRYFLIVLKFLNKVFYSVMDLTFDWLGLKLAREVEPLQQVRGEVAEFQGVQRLQVKTEWSYCKRIVHIINVPVVLGFVAWFVLETCLVFLWSLVRCGWVCWSRICHVCHILCFGHYLLNYRQLGFHFEDWHWCLIGNIEFKPELHSHFLQLLVPIAS